MPKLTKSSLLILVPILGISLFVLFTIKKIRQRDAAQEKQKEQVAAMHQYRQDLMSQISAASNTLADIKASEKAGTIDSAKGAKMEAEVRQGIAICQARADEFDRTNRLN